MKAAYTETTRVKTRRKKREKDTGEGSKGNQNSNKRACGSGKIESTERVQLSQEKSCLRTSTYAEEIEDIHRVPHRGDNKTIIYIG